MQKFKFNDIFWKIPELSEGLLNENYRGKKYLNDQSSHSELIQK